MCKSIIVLILFSISMNVNAQNIISLYSGQVPNAVESTEQEITEIDNANQLRYSKVIRPTLEIHLPEKSKITGAAVIIIPGGGYGLVAYTHEGTDIASEFNKMGVAAFILKYR